MLDIITQVAPIDRPNGFYRETSSGAGLRISEHLNGFNFTVTVTNSGPIGIHGAVTDHHGEDSTWRLSPGASQTVSPATTSGWYDFVLTVGDARRAFAGRTETGAAGITDPLMGPQPISADDR